MVKKTKRGKHTPQREQAANEQNAARQIEATVERTEHFNMLQKKFGPKGPKVEPARFSKAGEPTKRTVAEAIERLRTELQIVYGSDYTFVVMDANQRVIASHRSGLNHDTFIACTNDTLEQAKITDAIVDEIIAEDDETPPCGACGGELTSLGTLGNRKHYRCRNCGADQSKEG